MENFDLYRLDGHALKVFASVCETGSISRTAELFDLNQSTISHTVDKLRGAIHDPLFVKSGRGIVPSEKALALLPRVQRILAELEGLVAPETYDAAADGRPVVIAIPTPALLSDMRAVRARLQGVNPETRLEILRLAPRERVVQLLNDDEADVVIAVAGLRYPATLNHCGYGRDTLVVYYDPDCREAPSTAEAYSAAPHGVVNFGGATKSEVAKALAGRNLRRRVRLAAPTASMLGDLIRGTDVIATMPRALSQSVYKDLAHCPPPIPLPDIHYELVWHRRHEHSGRNLWLRQQLLQVAKGGP
ncbi:MAG: LysR family transcriptional regulator [Pseudomonadota bacterium]